jgi:hypothetical protein
MSTNTPCAGLQSLTIGRSGLDVNEGLDGMERGFGIPQTRDPASVHSAVQSLVILMTKSHRNLMRPGRGAVALHIEPCRPLMSRITGRIEHLLPKDG